MTIDSALRCGLVYLDDRKCTKMTVPIGSALRCLLEHWNDRECTEILASALGNWRVH